MLKLHRFVLYGSGHNFLFASVCVFCCKKPSIEFSLKKCSGCKLVFYCSNEHQKLHWPKHKQLCKAVQSMINSFGNVGLFNDNQDFNKGFQFWCKYRKSLIHICESLMKREMNIQERSLFLNPFCCKICHIYKHNKMVTCFNCSVITYCSEKHKEEDEKAHLAVCKTLKHSLEFSVSCVEGFNLIASIKCDGLLSKYNMSTFIETFVNISCEPSEKYEFAATYLSNILTVPLTLIYAIEKIDLDKTIKNLNIHIVGSGEFENNASLSWEYLFHYFKNLEILNLVFIGPESYNNFVPPSLMCQSCKQSRVINFKVDSCLYIEYVYKKINEQPDIIISFNCGFHEFLNNPQQDVWKNSMEALCKFSPAVLIFTSYTQKESKSDFNFFNKFSKREEKLDVVTNSEENPFKSMLPVHDDFPDDDDSLVFYNNNFINIIKT